MKVNMPVTNIEHTLRDGQTIVSRTDLKGAITYVNQDFIEISGFTEDELIGKSQNIVRHPDMPPAAFADLWSTIKSGRPWRGFVKNRCKNGDFYWVDATVTLIKKDGQVVGYQSVRRRPTRAQIAEVEKLYKAMNEGKAVKLGKSAAKGGMMGKLTIKSRLVFVIAFLVALLVVVGAMGLSGMSKASDGLKTVYEDRTVALGQISDIQQRLVRNRLDISAAINKPTPEHIREQVGKVEKNIEAITQIWEAYMATYLTPEEKKLADQFAVDRKRFVAEGIRIALAALRANDIQEANRIALDVMRPLYKPVEEEITALKELQMNEARQEYEDAQKRYATTRNIVAIAIVVALILAAWIGFALIRAIVRPLNRAIEVANAVADGDLTSHIEATSQDETGRLMQALHDMNVNLITLVGNVRNSVDVITTGTAEISTGNSDLSQRTEEQASSLEETASSMEELTSTVKQNAENAKQANQLAKGASDIAVKGGDVVGKVVTTMASINDSSKKIVDIISVIEGIAFQTNILALNAAVEAARAGEQGRGFAVVASEVRSLAQRSAAAAKEIKTLIGDSVREVEGGTVLVDQAGKTMEEIVNAVRRVTDIMAEISAASAEQSSGIEQVNQAIMQMDDVTQQNAALVEEAAAAAESLEDEAQNLSGAVSVFKLDSSGGGSQPVVRHEKPRPAPPAPKAARQPAPRKVAGKPKALPAAKEENEEWKEF